MKTIVVVLLSRELRKAKDVPCVQNKDGSRIFVLPKSEMQFTVSRICNNKVESLSAILECVDVDELLLVILREVHNNKSEKQVCEIV